MGREGGEDGDCGGGDVMVGEIEIRANVGDDSVPKIGGEMSGVDEIECELFGDGRGRGSDDFFDSRFGELFGFFAVNFKCPLFCFDSREREQLVPLNVLFFFFLKFFFLIFL